MPYTGLGKAGAQLGQAGSGPALVWCRPNVGVAHHWHVAKKESFHLGTAHWHALAYVTECVTACMYMRVCECVCVLQIFAGRNG